MEYLKAIWNHPLAPAVGVVLGALVTRLWQQYLQRMVTVRWSVTHTTLAAGGDHPTWGRVEIRHNGIPAGNLLQWCRVEIENESGSRDLSNLTSVPQSQAQASASCGRARSGGEWVVKRSSRGRRSKTLS